MKPLLLALFFALFTGNVTLAQHDTRAELNIRGGTEGIFVTPGERIWIATRSGDTYYTDHVMQPWHYGYFRSEEYGLNLENTFERVLFFDDLNGFISGFIYSDRNKTDIIYRTADGGKKWRAVPFGKEAWIDAACVTANGKAWMAGNSQVIYYSDDFGETWRNKNRPEDTTNQRIQTLFFLNDREGLAGTTWNRIYYTKDNCETWQIIETPKDQHKAAVLFDREKPEINKVILTPTQFIVNQNNQIFYSGKDSIVWHKLTDIIAFEYDKTRNTIYLIDKQLNVFNVGNRVENTRDSLARLKKEPRSLFARNRNLYVWSEGEIMRISDSTVYSTGIFTQDEPIQRLSCVRKAGQKTWGISDKHVYQSDNGGKSWYRVEQLDFSIGYLVPLNDTEAVIANSDHDRFYLLNTANSRLEDYLLPNRILSAFTLDNIVSVSLEAGSTGCFHHYSSKILFTKDGIDFRATSMTSDKPGDEDTLGINRFFFGEELVLLLGLIRPENRKKLTLSDFGITEHDRLVYRDIIDSLERDNDESADYYEPFSLPFKNVDYMFFRNFEKNLGGISSDTLESIVSQSSGNPSTTTDWRKITISTRDGQELTLTNSDFAPNAWYLPWLIEVNGFIYKSIHPELGKFYLKYFAGKIPETENARLIFDLAKRDYEEFLKDR